MPYFSVVLLTSGDHGAGTVTDLPADVDANGRPQEQVAGFPGHPGPWHLVGVEGPDEQGRGFATYAWG